MLAALEADGCWRSLDAVFTGYFPSAAVGGRRGASHCAHQGGQPAEPSSCVDPILGDAGKLYVATETAEAIRDRLLPLASIATPNLFELQWLTGASATERDEIADAARATRAAHSGRHLGPARRRRASPRCW